MSRRPLVVSLFAALALLAPATLRAVTYEAISDRELLNRSDLVVAGEVLSLRTEERNGAIETIATVRVDRSFKGAVAGTVDVRQRGGILPDGRWMSIPGVPTLRQGENVLLMLSRDENNDLRVRSLGLGHFTSERLDGLLVYVRAADEGRVVREAAAFESWLAGDGEAEYEQVTSGLGRVIGDDNHNPSYRAADYTLTSGGSAVAWPQNPSIIFNPARSDASQVGAAADAMSAWSAVEPSVSFGLGSADEAITFPSGTASSADSKNSFVFNVTNQELAARGGGENLAWTEVYGGGSYQHPHTGETVLALSEADVFIKGSPTGALRSQLLLHELGHALGFRHSNEGSPSTSAAVMSSSITGAYTTPQSWDQDAIQIVYGNGPQCNAPAVSISAQDTQIAAGTSTSLTATATGRSPFEYQWFRDGAQFASGTTNSVSTGNLPEGTYEFKVQVKDVCGNTAFSGPVNITVAACTPVVSAVAQPGATSVQAGQSTTISAVLNEGVTGPVTYRWYRATGNNPLQLISGSNTETISTGALTQSTRFQYEVSNACSAKVSNEVTISIVSSCVAPAITTQPSSLSITSGQTATLTVAATGTALNYQWYEGASGVTSNPVGGATAPSFTTPALTANRTYWVRVSNSCGSVNSAAATVSVTASCSLPQITSQPASANVTIGWPARLHVAASGSGLTYQWFQGQAGNTSNPVGGATSLVLELPGATETRSYWVRVTNSCGPVSSQTATLTAVCGAPPVPTVYVPGDILSGIQYLISWDPIPGASNYEIQEAGNPEFTGASTFSTAGNGRTFQRTVTQPTRYWYRVRAIAGCNGSAGAFSAPLSIGIVPPPSGGELNPTVTVPLGTTGVASWTYRVWGPAGFENAPFKASTDKPWLRVEPSSGTMRPEGTEITIFCTLDDMLAGTTTGTLILDFTPPAGKFASSNTGNKTSVPVSISVVTPVTTKPKTTPTDQTLIIPVVGHARGSNNSHFRSDVRITNTATQTLDYLMTFTPSGTDGTKTSTQTRVSIRAGETKAFNDIVKAWFGLGATGESAVGVLEVRPAPTSTTITPAPGRTMAAVATSRTYNSTPEGTFGQFIPGIAASEFLSPAKSGARISLQQVSQSSAFRTNLGLVEGSGEPAQINVKIFDGNGSLLKTVPVSLAAGEHRQINQFLAQHNVTVQNGRMEVELVSSTGSVSAYASVVDNATNDPMLVAPKVVTQAQFRGWVIPGVADLTNASASWRTDIRLFNAGSSNASVTMTFHPQNASGPPITRTLNVGAGQVVAMDGVLRSRFNLENAGGAIHLNTAGDSNLVATARTYNQRPDGTYGQFIPAVTVADSIGNGERKLELLQIEQSDAFRSHLGLAEMSGRPVVVEISAIAPDQLAAPVMRWPLKANEFTQLTEILKRMNLTTVYNARVTVRVVEGEGRVAAYASVIDNKTQDPTYVPAQ